MLKWRLLLGSLMIVFLAGLFGLDWWFQDSAKPGLLGMMLYDGLIVAILCSILCGAAAFELFRLARAAGHSPSGILMVLGTALLPLLSIVGSYLPGRSICGITLPMYHPTQGQLIGLVLVAAFLVQICRKRISGAINDIAWTVFGVVYLGLLGSFVVEVREEFGPMALVLLVVVAKGSDIGAYFTGRFLGRTKLIPWLSPGKTVEGLVGALIVACVLTVCINLKADLIDIGVAGTIGIGLLLGLVSHFGDLIESLIKRDCAVKDSSRLLPAFGGVLDLVDSVLPTALVWYIILSILGI